MITLECIKDLIMIDDEHCFTKGNKYEVIGSYIEGDVVYYETINDNNGYHLLTSDEGLSYFKSIKS